MQLQYLPLVFISALTSLGGFDLIENKIHFSFPILISQSDPADNANSGTPKGKRSPGGTRKPGDPIGTCPAKNKDIKAIVPENVQGITTQDYPVFWFYIPYTETEVHSIEFSLVNADQFETVDRIPVTLKNTPEIVAISLPQTQENALQPDRTYKWNLVINCTEKELGEENDILLYGFIEKNPLENQGESAGFRYDEVTEKAEFYRDSPNNIQTQSEWRELLHSINLEEYFAEKIGEINLDE
ncbi:MULTISPECIES: DUF928 domain-containing protein [Spirulina sp. CCY15215]|uniref:DUF928 domain-containing protein n=1 Tax=Spirulina sp. CCY15215 TaxID=2767591 RepID=UPI00194E7B47|nr:DUF928 domain-containing protein [Spirulina major]